MADAEPPGIGTAALIGTSGWSYDHWTPELYPPLLPPARLLARYTEEFATVELNASFYRWPRPEAFRSWRERLPAGFRMSVKAPRGLSHARRLRDPQPWLERIAAGWTELGEKAAVLLVQLGPGHERDDATLEEFLAAVPAAIPVTLEFRHPSWHVEEVFAILERRGAAYCVMSGARLPCILRVTAPFAYVRLHGPGGQLYGGSYSDPDLRWWADRVREWAGLGCGTLAYFNNDGEANAVRNARTLRAMLDG
jgi:uncharacterized protein YecE (DUF72 family)